MKTHLTVSMHTLNPGNRRRRKRRSGRKFKYKARVASCLDATFHAACRKSWAFATESVDRQNNVPTLGSSREQRSPGVERSKKALRGVERRGRVRPLTPCQQIKNPQKEVPVIVPQERMVSRIGCQPSIHRFAFNK